MNERKKVLVIEDDELLEGGDYKLVIKSRAGDAAGPLQTATKRVKYLKVVDPELIVTKTYPTDHPDRIGKFDNEGDGQTFEGSHLAGASLKAKYTGQSGTAYDDPINASEFTAEDDRIVIAGGDGSQWAGIATSVNADYPFEVTITTPNGSKVVTLEMN